MKDKQGVGGVISEIEPIRMYDYDIVCGTTKQEQKNTYPQEFMINVERLGVLKDQGSVGACVACVMSSLAEVFELIEETQGETKSQEELLELTKELEFSEGWAYGALRDDGDQDWGMIPTVALKNWSKKGMVQKKYFDLLVEVPNIIQITTKFPELLEKATPYKINSYASISYSDITKKDLAIKEALTKNGYGILGVSSNYWNEPHCIMIVGWNDKTNTYKIKNSWGNLSGDEHGVSEVPKSAINYAYVVFDIELSLPFVDVNKEDWFYKDLKNAYYAGLIKGVTDTEFKPLYQTTRAEIVTLIDRIVTLSLERINLALNVSVEKKGFNIETIKKKINAIEVKPMLFTDIDPSDWFYSAVKNCYNYKLIKGVTDIEFKPNNGITRAEMATLCVRVCNFIKDKISEVLRECNKLDSSSKTELEKVMCSNICVYSDVVTTDWFYDSVISSYQYGIMQGIGDNKFEPDRNINRAEVVAIINRLTKYLDIKNNILTKIF